MSVHNMEYKLQQANILAALPPTGDETQDADRIQAAIDSDGAIKLGPGRFKLNKTITLNDSEQSIVGDGHKTILDTTDNTFPAITISDSPDRIMVAKLQIVQGLYGVHIENGTRCTFDHVYFYNATSHGLYISDGSWSIDCIGCQFFNNGGSGINSVSDASGDIGNALNLIACIIRSNGARGVDWCANGLNICGGTIENNSGAGLRVSAANASATGINVNGVYFEGNGADSDTGDIFLEAGTSNAIVGMEVAGCYFNTDDDVSFVKATGNDGRVRQFCWRRSNVISGAANVTDFAIGDVIRLGLIEDWNLSRTDMSQDYMHNNDLSGLPLPRVMTHVFKLDCSATLSGATEAIRLFNAGTIIHSVTIECTADFNGDTTKSIQIGDGSTADAYGSLTNPTDGDTNVWATGSQLTADTTVTATVSNTGSATTGEAKVRITYTPGTIYDDDITVTA